jgi:hypothetical protein
MANKLPDHFLDIEIYNGLSNSSVERLKFPLYCGLLIKLRAGLLRVVKRSQFTPIKIDGSFGLENRLYNLVKYFCEDEENFIKNWNEIQIWKYSLELIQKSINLSPKLQEELCYHILYLPDPLTNLLFFDTIFLEKVKNYHLSVERPEGTFNSQKINNIKIQNFEKLVECYSREICASCLGCYHIYCGPCGGVRMKNANFLLPNRIELPFDVLILLHW